VASLIDIVEKWKRRGKNENAQGGKHAEGDHPPKLATRNAEERRAF